MFTGIIEEIGTINHIKPGSKSIQINIKAQKVLSDLVIGDSVAVNGVCLTAVEIANDFFIADVMPETLSKTTLRYLKTGSPVNLERALRLSDRLGGHIVQGHVDAVGIIMQKEKLDIAIIFRIQAPPEILRYTVPKGSIAVDGVSLTVVDVFKDAFTVSLIPHTAHLTILGNKNAGDRVNLESDIIGRYVEKLILPGFKEKNSNSLSFNFLAENGFV
ncbi:MAG: riboflavin synthase [Syntrophomonadaceae bacterium]